jgi:hypothetical protein
VAGQQSEQHNDHPRLNNQQINRDAEYCSVCSLTDLSHLLSARKQLKAFENSLQGAVGAAVFGRLLGF